MPHHQERSQTTYVPCSDQQRHSDGRASNDAFEALWTTLVDILVGQRLDGMLDEPQSSIFKRCDLRFGVTATEESAGR